MVTFGQFTTDFPEFANASQSGFNYYANLASIMLTAVWGVPSATGTAPLTLYDIGCELYIAHNLFLEQAAQKTAAAGGNPGASPGIIAAKAVDGVSVSYNTDAGSQDGAGNWNLSIYGTRFFDMASMLGAGPTVAAPGWCNAPLANGPAWPGPGVLPGWFGTG